MSEHLNRKDLKEDKFAVEVEHTVDFFAAHRKQAVQYGGAVVVLALVVGGFFYVRSAQTNARQQALGEAIALTSAPVTQAPSPNGAISFQSEAAKQEAVGKAFDKVYSEYKGQDEGYIAEYFLAGRAVDSAKLDDARAKYQDVSEHASANYASLAKLALAQIDFAQNRGSEAETLLKGLIDNPTDMVSKAQATVTLARGIAATRPDEARKLLQGISSGGSADLTGIATAAMAELPQK